MTIESANVAQSLKSVEYVAADLEDLSQAFGEQLDTLDNETVLDFAERRLDFRQGRPREDTPWEEGFALSEAQKIETINLAMSWKMINTSFPSGEFDHIVILGAHKTTLELRTNHATDIYEKNKDQQPGLILLSCFRPMHPKEGVDFSAIDTESDLAVALLEDALSERFKKSTVSCWEDLEGSEQSPADYAIASVGRIGLVDTVVVSGSIPRGSVRATTMSTLKSLRSYFEDSKPSLLFVTTSLHLPYQALQIQEVMNGIETEVVGISYPNLDKINLDTPDAEFRKVLQEIGATVKNFASNEGMGSQVSVSI